MAVVALLLVAPSLPAGGPLVVALLLVAPSPRWWSCWWSPRPAGGRGWGNLTPLGPSTRPVKGRMVSGGTITPWGS